MGRKMRHVTEIEALGLLPLYSLDWIVCGENETTKHIFERKGSKEYHLTTAKYTELTKRGGPQDKMKSVEKQSKQSDTT